MCWDSLVTLLKASGVVESISSTLSVYAFGSKGLMVYSPLMKSI